MQTNNNSGVILVAVVCFTAISAILALGLLSESGNQLKLADRQVRLEQAFYVAEGGAERAVSYIRNSGGFPPGVITGAIGNGTYSVAIDSVSSGGQTWFTLSSTGEVSGVKENVTMSGVRQDTWARFALWYGWGAGPIYFIANEVMTGPVHANTLIYLQNNPTFGDTVSSTRTNWGQWSANAVFSNGFQLGVLTQSLASVNFPALLSNATLVITGQSSITMGGTNVLITNPQRGWITNSYPVSTNTMIYVQTFGTNIGTVSVGGTNLDGRLTIVAASNIWITNHIGYAANPATTNSDDALGLIAQNDVVVRTNAPNNLNIYAHIISDSTVTNFSAGFYVQNYNTRPSSGNLTVYGGIVENNRGAVGQGSSGFQVKRYTYDTRFATAPPPMYPAVSNVYLWSNWRETTVP